MGRDVNQKGEIGGQGNVCVQIVGDGNTVDLGMPRLTLTSGKQRIRRPELLSEVELLNVYRESIPVVGREEDLGDLHEWLGGEEAISVRTVIGRAGPGRERRASRWNS
jgi:hypothetical protein